MTQSKPMRILLLLILLPLHMYAQDNYFQQRVDYDIRVSLDDQMHMLRGEISFVYFNASPDTLFSLMIHLWPNAYTNNQTDFSKQFTENGNKDFHFSKKEERGFIDSLSFQQDGRACSFRYYGNMPDIAVLPLQNPLLPGTKTLIKTPFRVKIPASVSRLGHTGQAYQITQWYPKPAVYDREGWHAMPYLDQGEFFSEFGNYKVQIKIPSNYIVAATGILETADEIKKVQEKAAHDKNLDFLEISKEKEKEIPSDSSFKIIEFNAEQVHDFAWFADKRFFILSDTCLLPSGKTIPVYSYFTHTESDLWRKANKYIKRSLVFYSKTVGEYPYPQATAVMSALGAGGGMEYPMITVIGKSGSAESLDIVITHEVGHNWFYGILATNEREYAWLDEGFNSYIEKRYAQTYYLEEDNLDENYIAYLLQSRKKSDQAVATPSQKLSSINYFLSAYAKPAMYLAYLESYLGKELMDSCLQHYFQSWQFRHPQPRDVQSIFEKISGKSLDWFFVDLIQTTKSLDYSIGHTFKKGDLVYCKVKNQGEITAPFTLSQYQKSNDSLLQMIWYEGVAKDTLITFNFSPDTYCKLNASERLPDLYLYDNQSKNNLPRIRFLLSTKQWDRPSLYLAPALGYNKFDGFSLGLAAYSLPVLPQKWEFYFAPLFGFQSKNLIGLAEIRRNFYLKQGKIRELSIAFQYKSFHEAENKEWNYHLRYQRWAIEADLYCKKKESRTLVEHQLKVQQFIIQNESPIFGFNPTTYLGKDQSLRSTTRLLHFFTFKHPIFPIQVKNCLEYGNYDDFRLDGYAHYIKLSFEGNLKIYYRPRAAVQIRLFMAAFPFHSDRDYGDFPLQLAYRNQSDYQYDDHFFGRNANEAFFSNQIQMKEGGFKTPIQVNQTINDGRSNHFLLALNISPELPFKLPIRTKYFKIKPYFDLAFVQNSSPTLQITNIADQIYYNGGISVDIGEGAIGVHFPLFSSNQLQSLMTQRGNFGNQISFHLDLNRFHPRKLMEQILKEFY